MVVYNSCKYGCKVFSFFRRLWTMVERFLQQLFTEYGWMVVLNGWLWKMVGFCLPLPCSNPRIAIKLKSRNILLFYDFPAEGTRSTWPKLGQFYICLPNNWLCNGLPQRPHFKLFWHNLISNFYFKQNCQNFVIIITHLMLIFREKRENSGICMNLLSSAAHCWMLTLITPAVVTKWCTLFEIMVWNNFAGLNMCCALLNAAHFEGRWVWLSFNISFYKDGTPLAPPSVHHCLYHIRCTQGLGWLGW